MKKLLVILALTLTISNCENEKDSGSGLEIYTLKGYQTKPDSHEIISGSEKLSKDPIIYYQDVISYDSTEHYFLIDSLRSRQMWKTDWPTDGTPFALTIDKQVIYSGYLVPGYSSSGVDWYSIDPLTLKGKLRVTPGYPFGQAMNPDLRNDERIIDLLSRDNKLN